MCVCVFTEHEAHCTQLHNSLHICYTFLIGVPSRVNRLG